MTDLIAGFTGNSKGMSNKQYSMVLTLLVNHPVTQSIHGGCIGSDIDFDAISYALHIPRIIFPSDKKSAQGKWHTAIVKDEKPPLKRNKDIVNSCHFMIATPKENKEIVRSGTWATIRYTWKTKKPIYIILPNGHLYE